MSQSVFAEATTWDAFFISPVAFNYTPETADFFLLFFDNVPLSVTFRFSFLAVVSEAFLIRELLTGWVCCEASVAGGCREVAGPSTMVDGAPRCTV